MQAKVITKLNLKGDIVYFPKVNGSYVTMKPKSESLVRSKEEPIRVSSIASSLQTCDKEFIAGIRHCTAYSVTFVAWRRYEKALAAWKDKGGYSLYSGRRDQPIPPSGKPRWLFKGYLLEVDSEDISAAEAKLLIREAVWKHEKKFEKLKSMAKVEIVLQKTNRRAVISDEVRIFVWQRDQGRCVQCSSKEALEFDHIIPIAKGGSNTARNLQILCEKCNRGKGDRI